jgi:hypothetical protein
MFIVMITLYHRAFSEHRGPLARPGTNGNQSALRARRPARERSLPALALFLEALPRVGGVRDAAARAPLGVRNFQSTKRKFIRDSVIAATIPGALRARIRAGCRLAGG